MQCPPRWAPCPLQAGVLLGNYGDTAPVSSNSGPCAADGSGYTSSHQNSTSLSRSWVLSFNDIPSTANPLHAQVSCGCSLVCVFSPATLAALVALILYERLGPPHCISEPTLPWEFQPAF